MQKTYCKYERRVLFNHNTQETFVLLEYPDILKCVKLSGDFSKWELWADKSKQKSDTRNYGSGILNTSKDKYKTEREGLFGEMAFSILSGIPIDEKIRKHGNDWDFSLRYNNMYLHIDVKNTQKIRNYGKGQFIIKNSSWKTTYYNKNGDICYNNRKICPLKSHAYFFTSDHVFVDSKNRKKESFGPDIMRIIIKMHGIISAKRINKNRNDRVGPSPWNKANWDCIYVKQSELMPPLTFFEKIEFKIPTFFNYDESIRGAWKGLEKYV